MAFCTKCGHEMEDLATPCPNCGHLAGVAAPDRVPDEAAVGEAEEAPAAKQAPGRLGLLVLGALLLIAFFMPIFDGVNVVMPNPIELLKQAGVAFIIKVLTVYPLIAGVAVIVLAFALKGLARTLAVIALGLFPIVTFYLSNDARSLIGQSGDITLLIGGALAAAGMALILAGSRARRYRPSSLLGAVVGAVGGAVYVIAMVLPILPKEFGRVPIVAPVVLIIGAGSSAEPVVTIALGCLDLLAKIFLLVAAAVCLANAAPRPVPGIRTRVATRLWIWSVIVLFLLALVPAGADTYTALNSGTAIGQALLELVVPQVSLLVKVALAALALFMLVPVGLTHLIVRLSPPEPEPLPGYAEATGPAVAQAGPAGLETRLKTLKQMLDEGIISQEDFDRKKEEILSEM